MPEEKKESPMPAKEAPKAAPASPKEPKKKGMSTGAKVAIGLGVGCLILVIAGAIFGYMILKRAAKTVEDELQKEEPFESLEEQLESLPEPEEFGEIFDEEEEDLEELSGKIGEALSDGEVEVTVNSVKKLDMIKDQEPYEGNKYLDVNMTLKNKTDKEITIFSSNFTVRDEKFNKYYIAYLEEDTLEDPISTWQYIPEDKEITGNIVFEVKDKLEKLELNYKGQKELNFDLGEL